MPVASILLMGVDLLSPGAAGIKRVLNLPTMSNRGGTNSGTIVSFELTKEKRRRKPTSASTPAPTVEL